MSIVFLLSAKDFCIDFNVLIQYFFKMAAQDARKTIRTITLKLTRDKNRSVAFRLNSQLWNLFLKACNSEKVVPTNKIEELLLEYLDERGFLSLEQVER